MDSAGKLAAAGQIASDNGTFQPVRSTDINCTNIKVYNNATVDRDLWVKGNMYLNTGTLFGSELDIDYVKVSTSLTSPQITTNNATVTNSISVPQLNTNYATVNTSMSSPYVACSNLLTTPLFNCGNTSMSTLGGYMILDLLNANT